MTPARQLAGFLSRYTPEVRAVAKSALATMRRSLPGATELVYDNYNALAIGFGPSDRASEAVFSIALYPRWVSLFFLQGARLEDPHRRLKGAGSRVRHVVLETASVLDEPEVRKLMAQALERAAVPIDPKARQRTIVKAVSARQRPRRPTP
jgi:hypothetical protein